MLVGTELNPAAAHRKSDGTLTNTLWGEFGWQLLGKEGYKLVAEADRKGVSPGAGVMRELFAKAAPCLILIDEWIAFLRQLYGVADLPAGSFDANMTFAQALTEAAKASAQTMVVASLPASDIEKGGEAGDEALARIKNTFGRLESPWTPAASKKDSKSCAAGCFSRSPKRRASRRAMRWRASSARCIAAMPRNFRPVAAKATISGASRRRIQSIPNCSTGCSRTGHRWISFSARAASCG